MSTNGLHAQNLARLFAPVASALADHTVSEIMINGPSCIYIERHGTLEPTTLRFSDEAALMAALRGVAQFVGRTLSAEQPVLEARMPDGSRIEAVIPPAAACGPVVCIRRYLQGVRTLDQLIDGGGLRSEGAALLARLVAARKNLLISGGAGSGKTSLLQALCALIPPEQRLLVIEDAHELQLDHPHAVQLEAQPAGLRGRGEVSVRKLFHATLRLRPDRIVIGELRGAEALELIAAMTSGHRGCLSTIHGTSAHDALARLETLALMSDVALPLSALRAQIASAIDVVVQGERHHDGRRYVREVTTVRAAPDGYALCTVYRDPSDPSQQQEASV